MKILVKRSFDEPDGSDGLRVLVDRLWPRGLTKGEVDADLWLKDIAPSEGLRKWFSHDISRWGEFQDKYFAELEKKPDEVKKVLDALEKGTVTFLYSAKDERHNNAVALKEYILSKGALAGKKAA